MTSWRYRAYNTQLEIITGLAQAESFHSLALSLRQTGYQIISAESIPQGTYDAELRLSKMRKRMGIDTASRLLPKPTSLIHKCYEWFKSLWQ